jgi:hypothetical protein
MSPPQNIIIPWSDLEADPGRLIREMEAGKTVTVEKNGALNYTVAPTPVVRGEFTLINNRQVASEVDQFVDELIAQLPTPDGLVRVDEIRQFLNDSFDEAEAEDMVSLPSKRTGVANTIFVPSGNPRHAPRIKIAVDPPDSFNPRGKSVSMQLHGDNDVVGDVLPPQRVIEQAKLWIKRNHAVLMLHWDNTISGDEVVRRLKPLLEKKSRPTAKKRPPAKRRPRHGA